MAKLMTPINTNNLQLLANLVSHERDYTKSKVVVTGVVTQRKRYWLFFKRNVKTNVKFSCYLHAPTPYWFCDDSSVDLMNDICLDVLNHYLYNYWIDETDFVLCGATSNIENDDGLIYELLDDTVDNSFASFVGQPDDIIIESDLQESEPVESYSLTGLSQNYSTPTSDYSLSSSSDYSSSSSDSSYSSSDD